MAEPAAPFAFRLLNSARLALAFARERRAAWLPVQEINAARDSHTRHIIRFAARHVPFYRETLRHLGASAHDFHTFDDLRRLPFVDPRDVHQNLEHFTAQCVDRTHWLPLDSSGSTGTSRVVYVDPRSLLLNTAHGVRDRQVVPGPDAPSSGYREACIGSYASSNARVQSFIAGHTYVPAARRLERLYIGMEVDPAEALERIIEFRPTVLRASGSYVNDLAAALQRSGPRHLGFGIAIASEGITTETRQFLTGQCGAPIVSIYGAVEALKIGFSCPNWSGIHVNSDLYPLRLVDEDGHDVQAGERGEVIVSNLMSRATVLLNYRLRDVAQWSLTPCPCGRTLPLLSLPEGRVCDWVRLPGGRRMHSAVALAAIQDMAGVLEFQVTQRAINDFQVQIVADGQRAWQEIEAELRANFHKTLGDSAEVTALRVDAIRREASGKRRLWVVAPEIDAGASTSS